MKARSAYLTSPAPYRYLLNFLSADSDGGLSVEISEAQLAGILITGTDFALRDQANSVFRRVPEMAGARENQNV